MPVRSYQLEAQIEGTGQTIAGPTVKVVSPFTVSLGASAIAEGSSTTASISLSDGGLTVEYRSGQTVLASTSSSANGYRAALSGLSAGAYEVRAYVVGAGGTSVPSTNTATLTVSGEEEEATYLLDEYTPTIHHSLTREKSDYSGPALRASRGDRITAVDGAQITIQGSEAASVYQSGDAVTITGSAGNDGTYTLASAPSESGGSTILTLSSPLPSPEASGLVTLEQDIAFSGNDLDEAALAALFAGCTEGRLERIYSQVAGCPAAIAPSYSERPYLYMEGELTRWANGHLAPWFAPGCDLVITGHGSIRRHAQTFFLVMQAGSPVEHASVLRVGGIEIKAGKYCNTIVTNNAGNYTGDLPVSLERPMVVSLRSSPSAMELFRNYNLKHTQPVTAADTSTTSATIGSTSTNNGCFYLLGACVFDSTLSDQDREAVYEHLARRWRCGPLRKAASPAPGWITDFEEGVELLDFINSLTIEDVEIDPSTKAFNWDGGGDWTGRLDELATLRALWDSGDLQAGHDALSEARWYVAEHGPDGSTLLPILDECTISSASPDLPMPGVLQVSRVSGGPYKEAFIKLDLSGLIAKPATARGLFYLLSETEGNTQRGDVGIEYAFDLDWDPATATWNNPPMPVKNGSTSYSQALGMDVGQTVPEEEDLSNILIEAYEAGATTLTLRLWMASGATRELTLHSSTDPDPVDVTVTYKAGIFGTGTVRIPYQNEGTHLYLLGTAGAALYGMSLPNADGSEANPYYKDAALGRRSLALACVWAVMRWSRGMDGQLYHAQGWAAGKVPRLLATIFYYTKDLLSPSQKRAFKRALAAYLCFVADRDNDGTLTNMEMMGVEGAGFAYAACDEGTPDDLAVRIAARKAVRNILHGKPYGGTAKNSTFRRNYYTTGFVGENDGPDPSYGGYSQTHTVACRALTYGDPDWDFLNEVVDGMYRFKAYNYAPHPYGGYWGMGAGWASRTASDMLGQLDQHYWVPRMASMFTEHAHPFFDDAGKDASQLVAEIQSSLNKLMSTSAEKSKQSGGWDGTIYKGLPPAFSPNSLWPSAVNISLPASSGWFTAQRTRLAAGAPSTVLPIVRGDHNVAHGTVGEGPGPEFWSYAGTAPNDRRFAFLACVFNRPFGSQEIDYPGYEGWHGAHISAFWVDGMGNVIDNRHGKTGGESDGDPEYEDTRRWSIAERWAYHGVLGFASFPFVALSGNQARISGNRTQLFKAGRGYWVAQATDNSLGTRLVTSVSYDAGADQTVLTFSDPSGMAVGSKIVWGVSSGFGGRDDQVSVFDIDGASPRVVATARIGAMIGGNVGMAGAGEIAGTVTVESEFTATASGVRVRRTITPDAEARSSDYFPTLDEVIPILLNDPDSSGVEATIEFDDGGWALASTSPVLTRHIRVGRGGEYLYITLPEERYVFLSPTVYQQSYQDNKRLRNICIDYHPDRGTPTLLPASTVIEYDVSVVDTTGVGGTAMSVALLDPAIGVVLPAGEPAAAHWIVQGGEAPFTHAIEISTDGGDTFTPLSGAEVREIAPGEFEAIGGAWPSGSFKLRVAVTDSSGETKVTSAHELAGAPLEQVFLDTFTDAPGTPLTDHTPDAGSYTFINGGSLPVIAPSGDHVVYSGSGSYSMARAAVGSHRQLVDVRLKGVGTRSTGTSIIPAATFRGRRSQNVNSEIRVGWRADEIIIHVPEYSAGRVVRSGFPVYDGTSWFRVRGYVTDDLLVVSVFDSTDTLVGRAASWDLGSGAQGTDRDTGGFHIYTSDGDPGSVGADDLKLFRF